MVAYGVGDVHLTVDHASSGLAGLGRGHAIVFIF